LAEPKLRRQFNRIFFEKLLVSDDETLAHELAPPFKQLLAPDLSQELQALSHGRQTTSRRQEAPQQNDPPAAFAVRGSSFDYLVELRGIEPLTYSMRTSRATNCATAPRPAAGRRTGTTLSAGHSPAARR
jgi:site-specific DNA recombinase